MPGNDGRAHVVATPYALPNHTHTYTPTNTHGTGVPAILEAEEIGSADKLSMITYLAQFYHAFKKTGTVSNGKKKKKKSKKASEESTSGETSDLTTATASVRYLVLVVVRMFDLNLAIRCARPRLWAGDKGGQLGRCRARHQ